MSAQLYCVESNNHVIYDEANGAENSETEANIDEESSVVGENTVECKTMQS